MAEQPIATHEALADELSALRIRLDTVLDSPRALEATQGVETVLRGLDEIVGEVEAGTLSDAESTRLMLLIHGLNAIVNFVFERDDEPAPEPTKATQVAGLEQFVAAFRKEARKRLSGLSISMMGLFDGNAHEAALEQSAGHLHAIRGGAAMLGLSGVAELAGMMEQIILSMRRLEPAARAWPTKAMLRGYSLLEAAVASAEVNLDDHALEPLRDEFQAALILDDDDAMPPMADESPTLNVGPMEQRILVVDDVETIAASVAFVLSELDIDIDIANNGEEAMEMLSGHPYSLVVTDVAMPRVDGIALTRMIRQMGQLGDIPIILLTSLDHPTERETGLEAGANDYIIKGSIGGGELAGRVQELLKIAPYFPARKNKPVKRPPARKKILVAEDAETVAASIAFVLSEGPYDIVLARDGKEALSRLRREDYDLLISDAQMPRLDGFGLIEQVRASADFARLPIVLLTANDSDKVRQQARDLGADRFLVKGEVGAGRLLTIVDELMDQYSAP